MIEPKMILDKIINSLKIKKITMIQLCEDIQISQSTLYSLSNRNTYPSLEVLYKIAKYLNLSIDDLLELSPEQKPDPIVSAASRLNDNQRAAVLEHVEIVKKYVK